MTPLTRLLLDRLASAPGNRWPFAQVMELALYHPEHGYYGPGPRRLGRKGDFYTAVSVGPLYGRLLAALADQIHHELGQPGDFTIVEQAAHEGQLAEDILTACDWPCILVEPNPAYREAQRQRLVAWQGRVRWVDSLADLPPVPALFVCNELPDAMPVHLMRFDEGQWRELYVNADLAFVPGPLSTPALVEEVARLPKDLPNGYTTEVGVAALNWIREVAGAPFSGAVFIADYGFDENELYAPERTTGTLRRYHHHQTDDRVLMDLGESDLTSHVNFTRLIEEAEANGLKLRSYEHQGRFLGKLGLKWLQSLEGTAPNPETQALLRQFHSLTHPAFMGRSFRVVRFAKSS